MDDVITAQVKWTSPQKNMNDECAFDVGRIPIQKWILLVSSLFNNYTSTYSVIATPSGTDQRLACPQSNHLINHKSKKEKSPWLLLLLFYNNRPIPIGASHGLKSNWEKGRGGEWAWCKNR